MFNFKFTEKSMESKDGMSSWCAELESALGSLFQKCANDEAHLSCHVDKLAFLAYTGKVELTVRDELAWTLQIRRDKNGNHESIGREHKRVDLAAFDKADKLQYLLQVKALYVGDLIPNGILSSTPHKLLNGLADDVHRKAEGVGTGVAFGLLLVTDIPLLTANPGLRLAYADIVRRQKKVLLGKADLWRHIKLLLGSTTPQPLSLVGNGGVWSGKHNGTDVHVHWHLVA